jgi:hypothetical protein
MVMGRKLTLSNGSGGRPGSLSVFGVPPERGWVFRVQELTSYLELLEPPSVFLGSFLLLPFLLFFLVVSF